MHGHQQLSLFNAHYDERCFLPIHVYDTEKGRPVAVVLRPGKTPGGVEVRAHLRRLIRHIRTRWHNTRITFRGDGHYARPEAMTWCENNGIDYIFGLSGTKPLAEKKPTRSPTTSARDAPSRTCRFYAAIPRRATRHSPGIANGAPSPVLRRRSAASTSVSSVTSLDVGSAEWIYDSLYCARGQAEHLIKLHKTQLASDRTSCRSAHANQVRLVLHTAAYWLMLTVRDAIPKVRELATAEFATLRLRLLKIAARVVETTSRIRLAFAAACPEARPDPLLAWRAAAARSLTGGACRPRLPNPSLKRVAKYRSSGGKKPKAILCASSDEMCGRINRIKKPHSHE